MVVLGTIAGEYKYYLWRLQAFNGLVYFLGDEFVLHADIFVGLVLQIHRSCQPWLCRATLRGKFAIIHILLHNVAEKLKTPGMHRVNVWNCIHKMWCRVSPQSSLDTVSASPRWMLRMYLDVEIWKLCAMTASAAVAPGRAGGSQPQIRAGNRKHCARCEDD